MKILKQEYASLLEMIISTFQPQVLLMLSDNIMITTDDIFKLSCLE